MTLNGNNSFSLITGGAPTRARARILPHTIYTNQNHKNHAGFLNFYNLEQKGLFIEEVRENSTSFATERILP